MQFKVVALLAIISAHGLLASAASTENIVPDNTKIPVELVKGVKSDKAKPGDPVRLRMAEAILAGKGLVIPGNAKLYGHVVRSGLMSTGDWSVLTIVVERAEWKGHVLPLNAYVVGWGRRSSVIPQSSDCRPESRFATSTFRPGVLNSSPFAWGFDASECVDQPAMNVAQDHSMEKIKIFRYKPDQSTVLVSKKRIHLQGGTLMMLQNQAASAPTGH